MPWQQLGLQHPARGAVWAEFQQDFKQTTGKAPSLLAGAGFDTARLLAQADAAPWPRSADGGIDAMGWLDPDHKEVVPICQDFDQRRRGERLRLKAVASDSCLRAGRAPSGQALVSLIG